MTTLSDAYESGYLKFCEHLDTLIDDLHGLQMRDERYIDALAKKCAAIEESIGALSFQTGSEIGALNRILIAKLDALEKRISDLELERKNYGSQHHAMISGLPGYVGAEIMQPDPEPYWQHPAAPSIPLKPILTYKGAFK